MTDEQRRRRDDRDSNRDGETKECRARGDIFERDSETDHRERKTDIAG
jgi:hypothetical protein